MTRFLLIRHATTDWVGIGLAGRLPRVSLTGAGRAEAEGLRERLRRARIDAVYASPLERARETAEAIGRDRGLRPETREGLTEVDFGDWTGRRFDELARDPAWAAFNARRATAVVPGGETMARVQARIAAELDALRERHPAGTVALVSHADVIRAALLHHLGMPLDNYARLEIAPASVTVLEAAPSGWRLVRLNDTGPLADGA